MSAQEQVEKLAMETDMSMANVSQHLKILRTARLVKIRRQGNYIFYRLADKNVFSTWQAIRILAEARLTEIERIVETFLTDRNNFKSVSIQELKENNQIVFRYTDADGRMSAEANVNGSMESIAGIRNRAGNVLGMMPHPERASESILGSEDGRTIFQSIINWRAQND